jgi:hypothetical protein
MWIDIGIAGVRLLDVRVWTAAFVRVIINILGLSTWFGLLNTCGAGGGSLLGVWEK